MGVDLRMYLSLEFLHKSVLIEAAEDEYDNVTQRNAISFTNAHSDKRFMQNATIFKDGSHLNEKGARMFTEKAIYQIIKHKETIQQ